MKKLLALLMLLCVALAPAASPAETETASDVTWEAYGDPLAAELGLEGMFIVLHELGLAFWVPSGMAYTQPSEADAADGRYALFMDDGRRLAVDRVDADGVTLEQACENAAADGMKEPGLGRVNGLDVLTYEDEENSAGCVVLADAGSMIIFRFAPLDGEAAKQVCSIITSSIMPFGK